MSMVSDILNSSSSPWGFTRKKQVDSVHLTRDSHLQLAKKLSAFDLVAIGVGATIGAGVYILVGTVAREHAGPALTLSFLIAGIAAALSAFCYAELACRCPSAGSAYHYTYICIGEGVAWLVGWALVLEYTIGAAAVARGITPNLALFFGGEDKLPVFLARQTIPGVGIVVDPCAAFVVLIVTAILCIGIKESSLAQMIVTTVNVGALLFVIIAGGYLGFKNGWPGYQIQTGFAPFGINGMFAGSAIVFFSYIGFDSVTSTAEEVTNPQRDLPLGIAIALSICCILYMLVSVVIVGLVPYFDLNPDTPISSAFESYGVQWAVYIITIGAATALFASLLGSILPQPRILMAMARDGLVPSFLSDINRNTKVPVKGTIVTGIFAAFLAFFMNVSQLAGMVSVGTLLAFTTVAISVLILRYVPPNEIPLPHSLQDYINSVTKSDNDSTSPNPESREIDTTQSLLEKEGLLRDPLLISEGSRGEQTRRRIAGWTIISLCAGILLFTFAASAKGFPRTLCYTLGGVGITLLMTSLIVLACTHQDNGRHTFGHTGGFSCPFVPFLPAACVLINTYLLIGLGGATWIRVSVWLVIGALVYVCYGRKHSRLSNACYVPSSYANEIFMARERQEIIASQIREA